MIALAAAFFVAQACAVGFACLLSAGGDPWLEPTLEPLPDQAQLVRWPVPAKLNPN